MQQAPNLGNVGGSAINIGLTVTTIDLTADQMNHLHSNPQTLVPAPADGTTLLPIAMSISEHPGPLGIRLSGRSGNVFAYGGNVSANWGLSIPRTGMATTEMGGPALGAVSHLTSAFANKALEVVGTSDGSTVGAPTAYGVDIAGTGYHVGDTGLANYLTPISIASVGNVSVGNVTGVAVITVTNTDSQNAIGDTAIPTSGFAHGDGNLSLTVTAVDPNDTAYSINLITANVSL